MRRMLLAMALIALASPVLSDGVKAATVTDNSLVNINRIGIQNNNNNTTLIVTAGVVNTGFIGGEKLLIDLTAAKANRAYLLKWGQQLVLPAGGAEDCDNTARQLIALNLSLSEGHGKITRPLPATRGKPVCLQPSQVFIAGGTGGMRNLNGVVWAIDGNRLAPYQLSNSSQAGFQVLRLWNQKQVTRQFLWSHVSGGLANYEVLRT